ncbi:universal stress protein [Parasphingopyxis marina]|uniref:Universal stress protein n=1 Tax=Parasphingopyxis marina TaxID=2761622 RepID=A0A842HUX6_9SPHN|nr:universal stress protein [Parasphingopyxis marina]MBC2776866.1 universal stress protein [Parasphingopyxis marina]
MRTYLVVIDETAEAKTALHYAAVRAIRLGRTVEIVALIPPQEFVNWAAVEATFEEEAQLRAEAAVAQAAGELVEVTGVQPKITVKRGDPVKMVREAVEESENIAGIMLGAAAGGSPGPLVTHFTSIAGDLPCPVIIVPGNLSFEELEKLG